MIYLNDGRPIIACSTGSTSNTAISKIRISGFENLDIFNPFFNKDLSDLRPNEARLVEIAYKGRVLDEAMAIFFKGPNSYNGENILELDVHGNQINVERIMNLFIDNKVCRMSYPGEFTYRALTNKKMNLSQVEGLDVLINSHSSFAFDQGMDTLRGELGEKYKLLLDYFVKLKASLELSIDFLEDVGEEGAKKEFNQNYANFSELISSLYQRTRGNVENLMTPTVTLIGQTNAGKSSLFNKLLLNNRSIVSDNAGTTRDYVSEGLSIGNNHFKLIDTAGIRETIDQIEKMGIERSFELGKRAFFKILVVNPFETNLEDLNLLKDMEFDFAIFTHSDISGMEEKRDELLKNPLFPSHSNHLCLSLGPIGPEKNESGPIGPVGFGVGPIGPEKNEGGPIGPIIEELRSSILNKFLKLCEKDPIIVERHRQVIGTIYDKTQRFQAVMNDLDDPAILSSELDLIGNDIGELIGIISPDEVLASIFSNFCIGK
jgi:tRNA modification GTPase